MKEDLKQNKAHAIAFYKMAYEGNPRKAVELYVGDEYIQHNPLVGDGKEAFIGGMNISARHLLSHKKPVLDYHSRICGPVVPQLLQ